MSPVSLPLNEMSHYLSPILAVYPIGNNHEYYVCVNDPNLLMNGHISLYTFQWAIR